MKKVIYVLLLAAIVPNVGCAPQQHQSTAWTMEYYCNGNTACINNFHAYSGSGSFSSESDCLAWETGFLNVYTHPQASCTSCTGN